LGHWQSRELDHLLTVRPASYLRTLSPAVSGSFGVLGSIRFALGSGNQLSLGTHFQQGPESAGYLLVGPKGRESRTTHRAYNDRAGFSVARFQSMRQSSWLPVASTNHGIKAEILFNMRGVLMKVKKEFAKKKFINHEARESPSKAETSITVAKT
jgi:hypothetical protein